MKKLISGGGVSPAENELPVIINTEDESPEQRTGSGFPLLTPIRLFDQVKSLRDGVEINIHRIDHGKQIAVHLSNIVAIMSEDLSSPPADPRQTDLLNDQANELLHNAGSDDLINTD